MQVPTLQIQDKINPENYNSDEIYLITQFYIPDNEVRKNEIKTCLKRNVDNGSLKKIFLINEKKYTNVELGVNEKEMKKIQQIIFNGGTRLKYSQTFALIKYLKRKQSLSGYFVIANSDIFVDDSINNVRKTSLSVDKSIYALLRHEFNEKRLRDCKLFGPRPDSQDAWIIHTKYLPDDSIIARFDFYLGAQGCDNVLAFMFLQFGYKIFNEPTVVKIYHYHTSKERMYMLTPLQPPYLFVTPVIRN
jgi:hypothetical protein